MPALYQKYRPGKFADVLGQRHIVLTLQNAVRLNKVSHAYLFCGSRGVGKTTLARILAKAVNCESALEGDACGACRPCLEFSSSLSMDTVEIDAASYTGVDNVREIIEQSRSLPAKSLKRIYIIDEVHMLSRAAFNALLKTLEEPPPHVIFILATTEAGKVPATVLSRVQRFDFLLHSKLDVLANLKAIAEAEGVRLPDDVLNLVAESSQGGMRDSLTLLDHVMALGVDADGKMVRRALGLADRVKTLSLLTACLEGKAGEITSIFAGLEEEAIDFKALTEDCLKVLRGSLEETLGGVKNDANIPALLAISTADLVFLIRLFLRAHKDQGGSPDPSLPLFLACAEAVAKFYPDKANKPAVVKPDISSRDVGEISAESSGKVEDKSEVAIPVIAAMDVDTVRLLWGQVCEGVTQANMSLGTLLKQAHVESVALNRLNLVLKFDFHRKKLVQPNYLEIVLAVLKQNGLDFEKIEVSVDKDLPTQREDGIIATAMQILGGEVLE